MKYRKFRTVLLAAVMAAAAFSPEAKAAEITEETMIVETEGTEAVNAGENIASGTIGQVNWVIDGNGKLTVSGTGDVKKYAGSRAPWEDYADQIKTAKINVTGATSASNLFYNCENLTSVDLSGFDTSQVTNMYAMFWNCSSLTDLDLRSFDTSQVTDMRFMFWNCSSLREVDLSSFRTSNVTDMGSMFKNCSSLTSLDVSSFNTSKVTDMSCMFLGCSGLENLDLSSFNTSNVTNMTDMFENCSGLTSLDVSSFDTSKVTKLYYMFSDCSSLTSLDLSNFNTSQVTDMGHMFEDCSELKTLNIGNFDTSQVTSMWGMFWGCNSLLRVDVSGFDTSNVKCMSYMFCNCNSLQSINVSSFDTSNVTEMNGMFEYCRSLRSIDVRNFDTSQVTDMTWMFCDCSSLKELDLSSFDMSNVERKNAWMLEICSSLEKVKTPRNCAAEIDLPVNNLYSHWEKADGTEITTVPQGSSQSIVLTKKKASVTKIFSDVSAGAWYLDPVQFVYDRELMSGYWGKFTPNDTMTRAMLIQTLYRLSGEPRVKDYSKYLAFKDVKENDWYMDAVAWAVNKGITTGDTYTGKFNPNASVTREQLATFLYRYSQYMEKDVTLSKDMNVLLNGSNPSSWSAKEFAWSIDQGLISGIQKTNSVGKVTYDLAPKGTATRAQLATILQRFCEK